MAVKAPRLTGGTDDIANRFQQDLQGVRYTGNAQTQPHGGCDDQHVSTVQFGLGQYLYSGGRHRAEHDQGRTAQHRFRHLLQHTADDREQAQPNL